MSSNILENYYDPLLQQNNFIPVKCPEKFSPAGSCWKIAQSVGEGYYWIYGRQDLFDIKIHDFYFHEDFCLDVEIPEGINIQCFDSISGEELNPYRRLSAGDIETIVGEKQRYRALIPFLTLSDRGVANTGRLLFVYFGRCGIGKLKPKEQQKQKSAVLFLCCISFSCMRYTLFIRL